MQDNPTSEITLERRLRAIVLSALMKNQQQDVKALYAVSQRQQ